MSKASRYITVTGEIVKTVTFPDPQNMMYEYEAFMRPFGEELVALISDATEVHIELDFQGVDMLSYAVIGKLHSLHKEVKKVGGILIFLNLNKEIIGKLTRMKFHNVFRIETAPVLSG